MYFTGVDLYSKNDNKVIKAKQLCAELINLVKDEYGSYVNEEGSVQQILYRHTLTEILNAQMNIVKFLTFDK
jgi:hypothetical protein